MEFDGLPRAKQAPFSQRRRDPRTVLEEVLHRQWHLQHLENAISYFLEDDPLAFIRAVRSPRGKNTGLR